MIRFDWLVWTGVVMTAVCSCASPAQELSTYWNGHNVGSLEVFDDMDAAEDRFDGYVRLLTEVRLDDAVEEMNRFMDSASRDTVAYMVWSSLFEPFLHAVESPYRNDALFVAWLDKVLEDRVIDDGATMERLRQIRNVMELNVVGKPAADARLSDAEGDEFNISDLRGRKTLLLLLDANCPSCMDRLNENLKEYGHRDVNLVAVLVNGSPAHIGIISQRLPEEVLKRWTLAWCPGREIEKGKVYDLTMVPSRILLDKECRIKKLYY